MSPSSAEDVAELLRDTAANDGRVSTSRIGDSTESVTRIDLAQMTSTVDYPARDMTITVQAGMSIGELSRILAEENQQLPIDSPDQSTTLGALVAGNTAGARRYGYGTLRDYLIGVEAVDGQGRIFHAGGRVVKNVAGYDLCRLMIGSRGSLGVLTQLTFKLKPRPEHTAGASFEFANAETLEAALERLNQSAAHPVILDLSVEDSSVYSLHLAVEGNQQTCDWQLDQLRSDCVDGTETAFATPVEEFCKTPSNHWTATDIRIQTLPSRVVTIASSLSAEGMNCHGQAGNGILYAQDSAAQSERRKICEALAGRHSGTLMIWDHDHPISRKDALTLRMRKAFDPQSIFVK